MIKPDEFISQEIFLQRREIKKTNYKPLVDFVIGLASGETNIRAIKKKIKIAVNDFNVRESAISEVELQSSIMNASIDYKKVDTAQNQTIDESMDDFNKGTVKMLMVLAVLVVSAIASNSSTKELSGQWVKRLNKRSLLFVGSLLKSVREYIYSGYASTGIYAWVSLALLDGKTSVICIHLHNKVYLSSDYGSRFELPYQIPRHPNCRSILVAVGSQQEADEIQGLTISKFFRDNPNDARAIMGHEKYRLWVGGEAKINNYIDAVRGRWFTNEEVIRRLGIKSSRRLNTD